jgi:hypothetical protein
VSASRGRSRCGRSLTPMSRDESLPKGRDRRGQEGGHAIHIDRTRGGTSALDRPASRASVHDGLHQCWPHSRLGSGWAGIPSPAPFALPPNPIFPAPEHYYLAVKECHPDAPLARLS